MSFKSKLNNLELQKKSGVKQNIKIIDTEYVFMCTDIAYHCFMNIRHN